MIQRLEHGFESLVGWIYSTGVDPLLYSLGLMSWAEHSFDATGFFVGGLLQVIATAVICIPLEHRWPVYHVDPTQWAHVRTDVIFTLINKLGLIPLFSFALLYFLLTPIESWLHLHGVLFWDLEDALPLLSNWPALSLLCYVLIIDFTEYWRHRLQHRANWWWQLHAMHHAQREMTFWTDDRNHVIDEWLAAFLMATVALLIGVPPQQFPLALFVVKLIESLSHANLRWNFRLLRYLLVSPQFHRVHHGIRIGHEGQYQGVNFGVVFPFWDVLFHTADFRNAYPPTGITDQLEGHDYGTGFWQTQWLGFRRLLQSVIRRQGASEKPD